MLRLFRLFQAVPITWLMLFVSGMLWAADTGLSRLKHVSFAQAQLLLGAESLERLWDGAWWSVLTTAFHHGGLFHLLCNGACLWWFGRLLETRMGSWRYALFSLLGLAVSGATQSIWTSYVGISGMLCAHLGLIWAWRETDPWLQNYVQKEQIRSLLIWLLICLPITWLGIMQVGNAAHFSGLFYGFCVGQVYFGRPRVRLWKPVFLVAHVGLIPFFYLIVHPFWNGNYHWHLGDNATTVAEKRRHYADSVLWDPSLEGPWMNVARLAEGAGRLQEAWDWTLACLQHHPSHEPAINFARHLWLSFPNREAREEARFKLRHVFGEASPQWEKTLLADAGIGEFPVLNRGLRPVRQPPITDGEAPPEPESPFKLPLRALDEIPRPQRKLPAPDPDLPGSAEAGRSA